MRLGALSLSVDELIKHLRGDKSHVDATHALQLKATLYRYYDLLRAGNDLLIVLDHKSECH